MSLVILQHLLGFFQLISILMKIIVKGAIEWTIQIHWQHWIYKTKANKTKNTTQKTKMMSGADLTKNQQ
jgi:hypothetical protein